MPKEYNLKADPAPGKVWRVTNGPAAAGGDAVLIQLNQFSYIGSYWLRHTGGPTEMRYGRDLTAVQSRNSLIGTAIKGDYSPYEFAPATPTVGTGYTIQQYNEAFVTKNYAAYPYTTAGALNLIGTNDETGSNGVCHFVIGSQEYLFWNWSVGYNSSFGHFGYAELDYTTPSNTVGYGRFNTQTPSGMKAVSHGAVRIPQWYSDLYCPGMNLALVGGYSQSVISKEDLPMGLALTACKVPPDEVGQPVDVSDLAATPAGTTTVTSAAAPFTAAWDGAQIRGPYGGTGFTYVSPVYVDSYVNSTTVTVTATLNPLSAASGALYNFNTVVPSTMLMGFYPSTDSPAGGSNRWLRPDGDVLKFVHVDSWGGQYFTWTDSVMGTEWIDFEDNGTHYHGIVSIAVMTKYAVGYNASNVEPIAQDYAWALTDPMKLDPVAGNGKFVYPDEFTWLDLSATVDPSLYAQKPEKAITSITSNAAKLKSDLDGCLVNCVGHGLTGTGQLVAVGDSEVSEYNSIWKADVVDSDNFYIYNLNLVTNWGGVTSDNPECTSCKASERVPLVQGCAFLNSTKQLHVLHQMYPTDMSGADALQQIVDVFQWSAP